MNADLEMIEALLAHMQQNSSQIPFDDMGDDDDDDYDDEEEDDDDDDYYTGGGSGGEHSIHTLLNPYGGGGGDGEMGSGGGQMGIPMQAMSFLQGLLNMNNSSMPDVSGGMGGPIGGGMGGMGSPMEGGSGGFLPNMQSFSPNMNPDMAGALAGAFAGGVSQLMDMYGGGGSGATIEDYDDDDLSDEEDEDEEDDEDDEEEDDDEDDHVLDSKDTLSHAVTVGALGAVGGMMATAMMASQHPPSNNFPQDFHGMMPQRSAPALPPPAMSPPTMSPPQATTSIVPALTTSAPVGSNGMSGGTVSRVDPFAGLALTGAAVATGGLLSSGVNALLSSSGGKTLVNNKLDTSDASSTTLIGNDSLNTSSKTITDHDDISNMASKLNRTHISTNTQGSKQNENTNRVESNSSQNLDDKQTIVPVMSPPKPSRVIKDDSDDEKASVPGSETSGGGKSDTESVRKKTPSPVLAGKMGRLSPTSSESTHGPELASCASITDLASATESMRDSDTDNHSDAHNVTANLSDLDNDMPEQHKHAIMPQTYPIGSIPFLDEVPAYGWETMVGLETPKEQMKKLFFLSSFPEVFEGTRGTARGVLLFGPSGSGKTCLGRALAKECNKSALLAISCGFLVTQPATHAVAFIKYVFEAARSKKPSVLLFDDVDALNTPTMMEETRLRARAELLAQVRGKI